MSSLLLARPSGATRTSIKRLLRLSSVNDTIGEGRLLGVFVRCFTPSQEARHVMSASFSTSRCNGRRADGFFQSCNTGGPITRYDHCSINKYLSTRRCFSSLSTMDDTKHDDTDLAHDGREQPTPPTTPASANSWSEPLQTDVFAKSWDEEKGNESNTISRDIVKSTPSTTFTSSPSSLSDLLHTDIFSESWSEPTRKEAKSSPSFGGSFSSSTRKTNYGNDDGQSFRMQQRQHPSTNRERGFDNKIDWSSFFKKPLAMTSDATAADGSSSQLLGTESKISLPKTSVEIKYDAILQQTNQLLDALSAGTTKSPTMLQLMDFDKVMVQWSRFHSEVDNYKKEASNDDLFSVGSSFSTRRNHASLKRNASEKCMELLTALERNYDCIRHHLLQTNTAAIEVDDPATQLPETKHSKLMPNAASYNLALNTLAHSNGMNVAQEAFAILDRMLDRCQQYLNVAGEAVSLSPPPEPTIITYNSVIHAIAKSGARDAGYLAEEAFARMEAWKNECDARNNGDGSITTHCYRGVRPDPRTLACVLDAWANAKTHQQQSFASDRTSAILDLAVKKRRAYVNYVNSMVYGNDYIADYLETEDEDAVAVLSNKDCTIELENGLSGIDDVEEEYVEEDLVLEDFASPPVQTLAEKQPTAMVDPFLKPNTVAFNTALHAWASSRRGREGARRAHGILEQMERLNEGGLLELPNGHADETISTVEIDLDDSEDADSTLKPNVRSYSMVMNAWAKVAATERGSGEDAAANCEMILAKMEERGAEDVSVRPNVAVYTTCIIAWARTTHLDYAASKAEDILNRMIDLYYSEGKSDLPALEGDMENANHDAPFNAVITAYARSSNPNAGDRALAVLERLEASCILPTATTYNAVMDVCAKHGQPDRALQVFERMREQSISPDPTSYDTVLNAFARDETIGSAERAWEFLCRLEQERLSGESDFIPSSVSYSTVINAFARSSGRGDGGVHVVEKAKEVYKKLIEHIESGTIYGDPDPFANSCFLNCCANLNGPPTEKREALIMAINAFEEMKKNTDVHGEPNQYTFGTMMKVAVRLTSDAAEKNRLMESLFGQACKRGFLSQAVMAQFLRHTPPQTSMKVIMDLGGTKRDIPEAWYRRVPRKHWPSAPDHERRNDGFRQTR